MKSSIFLYFLMFNILLSCSAQTKIGENQNGKYVITVNEEDLIKAANKILKIQEITQNLTKVSINEDFVDNTNQNYYYIKFTNDDNSIKLVQLLNLEGNNFTLLKGASTVTCSGCRKGCDPKRYLDKDGQVEFYCSDCTLGDTKDCKKSVTQSNLEL